MLAEIIGNVDFSMVASEYSCILAGVREPPIPQADVRGFTCFDSATAATLGVAQATNSPVFGNTCNASGLVIGDGVVNVYDVTLALMVHYGLGAYSNVTLDTTTITAPVTGHALRCAEHLEHDDPVSAPVITKATCSDALIPGPSRRLASHADLRPRLELAEQKGAGMWVKLVFTPGSSVIAFDAGIQGDAFLPGVTYVKSAGAWSGRADLETDGVAIMLDPAGTGFELQVPSQNTIWGSQFQGPYGAPTVYIWTSSAKLCIQEGSSVAYVDPDPAFAAYTFDSSECVFSVPSPGPVQPPAVSPPAASPSSAQPASPGAPPSPSVPSPTVPSPAVGTIVGATLGALVAVGCGIAACLVIRKRRRTQRAYVSNTRPPVVQPLRAQPLARELELRARQMRV